MTTSTTVPLTITPEAAARVAELGMQAELEQMLEQARQIIPGLTRLHVVRLEVYDTGGEPNIGIEATTNEVWSPGDKTWDKYSAWKLSTFPPEVWTNFTLLMEPGADHAG